MHRRASDFSQVWSMYHSLQMEGCCYSALWKQCSFRVHCSHLPS